MATLSNQLVSGVKKILTPDQNTGSTELNPTEVPTPVGTPTASEVYTRANILGED
jgi:hypothetical protein